MHRPSELYIRRQTNEARTLTSSLCQSLIKSSWLHSGSDLANTAVDLKEKFKASKAKVYPLSRNEREEVQKFVDKHLKKGYIRPSKSEQTSPVFFVGKKDGEKCMVMDYQKLNRQTVKNNYPLSLIMELVDVTNFIWIYLHKYWVFFNDLSCIGKPSRRPFQ